ncbi:MAG: hypothetical protein HYX78_03660 [Armatimonadetes bacterium]|nr:hypothetical protein [Armatimonadota bacterium]
MNFARPAFLGALAALLGLVAANPCPALDLADLIRKSETADNHVSYRGLKFADLSVGGRTIRAHFKVLHQEPDRTRTEYFTPPELSGIIVIERGSENWRFLPSQQQWQHNKWELSVRTINLAIENYKLLNGGQEVVAGRQTHVVKLHPKKRGNPSETIWIDTEYNLVLRTELRNSSGAPISVSAFRQIDFEPQDISDSAFEVKPDVKRPNNPVPELGFEAVKPKYLPKGYSFGQVSTIPIGKDYAAHLMYTDGINTISIFEKKRSKKKRGDDYPGLGKWANVIRFDRGGITFTIISDIDKRELQKIADSIK